MREQDDQLESLFGTAKNIHEIATTVGTELEDQNMYGKRLCRILLLRLYH